MDINETLSRIDKLTLSYAYHHETLSFVKMTKNVTSVVLKHLIDVVNELSANKIQFSVDKDFNILVNVVEINPNEAFAVSLDSSGSITDINDIALEMSGYSKDELINKVFFDIFIDDKDKEEINQIFLDILSEGCNYWKNTNNIILRDGSKKLLTWSNVLIKNEDNSIQSIHSFGI